MLGDDTFFISLKRMSLDDESGNVTCEPALAKGSTVYAAYVEDELV